MDWKESKTSFSSSANEVADLVQDIEDWERPGLGAWDLRGLVGHYLRAIRTPLQYLREPESNEAQLASAAAYVVAYLQQRNLDPSGTDDQVARRGTQELANPAVDPDPAALIRREVTALGNLLDRQPPTRVVATPLGSLRLDHYMRTRTMELVVHGLDIARAVARPWTPPAPQLQDVLDLLTEVAIATGSGTDLLLVLSGRTPPEPANVLPVLR